MQEQAFWQAIQEAPEDDAPRLIYADWLEDQGDPARVARAEFIRVQCELARLPEDDDARRVLQDREQALWKKHGKAWCAPLKPFSRKFEFRRGFPDQVLVQGRTFLDNADAVLSAAPVFSIRLRKAKDQIADLARCPALERLISLSLYWNHIGQKRAQTFATSPHLGRLSELDLDDNNILPRGLRALLGASLPRLTSLNLRANKLGDAGLELLAGSPLLGQLRTLGYSKNEAGNAGLAALAASPHAANLTHLDLSYNQDIGDAGVVALASSPHVRRLTWLSLEKHGVIASRLPTCRTGITSAGARELAQAPSLAGLTHLNLAGQSRMGDEGVAALTSSPNLAALTHLDLRRCNLSPAALEALATASFLDGLTSLDLGYNRLGSTTAWQALLEGGRLRRLRRLDLSGCEMGDAGVEALAAAPCLAGLRELSLHSGCGPRGVQALASSPHLAGLLRLDLLCADLGNEGALALARSPYLKNLRQLHVSLAKYARSPWVGQEGQEALLARFGEEVCVFR